jgi:hypothetical protein
LFAIVNREIVKQNETIYYASNRYKNSSINKKEAKKKKEAGSKYISTV